MRRLPLPILPQPGHAGLLFALSPIETGTGKKKVPNLNCFNVTSWWELEIILRLGILLRRGLTAQAAYLQSLTASAGSVIPFYKRLSAPAHKPLTNPDKEGEEMSVGNCVSIETLVDYSSEHPRREISVQERSQIEQHLQGCCPCRETAEAISEIDKEIISGVWDNVLPLSPGDEKRMEKEIDEIRLRLERLGVLSHRTP